LSNPILLAYTCYLPNWQQGVEGVYIPFYENLLLQRKRHRLPDAANPMSLCVEFLVARAGTIPP